jgi:Domain of unknown function (DUF4032)
VMADAETVELVDGPLSEGLRQQDLEAFVESLEWQAEDIRLARGLPDDQHLVTAGDAAYFRSRYSGLRAEHQAARAVDRHEDLRALDLHLQMRRLAALGYGVLDFVRRGARVVPAGWAVGASTAEADAPADDKRSWHAATLRPGWYVQRLRELLGAWVPRAYAQRLYQHMLIHKWLLSERAGHDVGMEAAARDWDTHYHQPALAFIAAYLPDADASATYAAYVAILDHTWEMSQREQREVPLDEGAVDYVLAQTPPSPLLPGDAGAD